MSTAATEVRTAKSHLLARLPVLLSTKQLAELFNVHNVTMQRILKNGSVPFRNVSIEKRGQQFLAIEVVDYLLGTDTKQKKGRPVGSRNKKTQA